MNDEMNVDDNINDKIFDAMIRTAFEESDRQKMALLPSAEELDAMYPPETFLKLDKRVMGDIARASGSERKRQRLLTAFAKTAAAVAALFIVHIVVLTNVEAYRSFTLNRILGIQQEFAGVPVPQRAFDTGGRAMFDAHYGADSDDLFGTGGGVAMPAPPPPAMAIPEAPAMAEAEFSLDMSPQADDADGMEIKVPAPAPNRGRNFFDEHWNWSGDALNMEGFDHIMTQHFDNMIVFVYENAHGEQMVTFVGSADFSVCALITAAEGIMTPIGQSRGPLCEP